MIGKRISEIRRQKGLTLSELADRANISKSYLSSIERNLNQNPSIQVVSKIALELNVDLTSLLNPKSKIETLKPRQPLEKEWLELVNEIKASEMDKEKIQEYKILLEYIKWKSDN